MYFLLFLLLNLVIVGIWTHQIRNALTGYYLTLLIIQDSFELAGKEWSKYFLAQETGTNVILMTASLLLRLSAYPPTAVFEPALCMEDCIEYFFGLLKTIKRNTGSVTLASAIQSACLVHVRQQRNLRKANLSRHAHPCPSC